VVPFGKNLLRAVTHLEINGKDIEKAIEIIKKIFQSGKS
jgi:hypothetical protein